MEIIMKKFKSILYTFYTRYAEVAVNPLLESNDLLKFNKKLLNGLSNAPVCYFKSRYFKFCFCIDI